MSLRFRPQLQDQLGNEVRSTSKHFPLIQMPCKALKLEGRGRGNVSTLTINAQSEVRIESLITACVHVLK